MRSCTDSVKYDFTLMNTSLVLLYNLQNSRLERSDFREFSLSTLRGLSKNWSDSKNIIQISEENMNTLNGLLSCVRFIRLLIRFCVHFNSSSRKGSPKLWRKWKSREKNRGHASKRNKDDSFRFRFGFRFDVNRFAEVQKPCNLGS